MAKCHSTGKSCPHKIQPERRVTVRAALYEYPPRSDDPPSGGRRLQPVPWLQMKGRWLEAAGFDIRTPVRVRVMRGCLVLTAEEE